MPAEQTATAVPPHDGWLLIARRRVIAGRVEYNRGAVVPAGALGKNFEQLIRGGFVGWSPPDNVASDVRPRDLGTPHPARQRVEPVFVEHADPLVAWRASKEATAKANGGDWGRAHDQLISTERGAKMYRAAVRVGAERDARAHNRVGRRIVPAI